jgi:hypothetical protein
MRTLKALVAAVALGLLVSPALTYACDAPACKGKCKQTEQCKGKCPGGEQCKDKCKQTEQCKQKQANGGCKQDPSKCPMNGKK